MLEDTSTTTNDGQVAAAFFRTLMRLAQAADAAHRTRM